MEDSTTPQAPMNIKVIDGNTRIYIRWNASTSPDVGGYKIYYGTASGVYVSGNYAYVADDKSGLMIINLKL